MQNNVAFKSTVRTSCQNEKLQIVLRYRKMKNVIIKPTPYFAK